MGIVPYDDLTVRDLYEACVAACGENAVVFIGRHGDGWLAHCSSRHGPWKINRTGKTFRAATDALWTALHEPGEIE